VSKLTIVLRVRGEDYPDFNVNRDDPSTNVLAGLTVEVRPDLLAFTVDPKVGDSAFVFLHPDDLRTAIAAKVRDKGSPTSSCRTTKSPGQPGYQLATATASESTCHDSVRAMRKTRGDLYPKAVSFIIWGFSCQALPDTPEISHAVSE
jgi:hypothetical protein